MRSKEAHPLGSVQRAVRWLLVLGCALGCRQAGGAASTSFRPRPTCAPCDGGARSNTARQAQLEAQWRAVAPKVGLPTLDLECLCFGTVASTSVEDQAIYLPSDWELREQTARAAHLALHRHQPPWNVKITASCDARVEHALAREVDGHALELETRRALKVPTARYPFEKQYFATPPDQRRAWLRDYFLAHPDGDGVVPAFLSQYRARCQR